MRTTPSTFRYIQSLKDFILIAGPFGSGKSAASCYKLMNASRLQEPNKNGVRHTRHGIFRKTYRQLKDTTWPTFASWFHNHESGEVFGEWRKTDRTFVVDAGLEDGTRMVVEFLFRALDRDEDVNNLTSLELSCAWFNEWREITPVIHKTIGGRINRWPRPASGVECTNAFYCADTNYPDADTFHQDLMFDMPTRQDWELIEQPPALLSHDEWIKTYAEEPRPFALVNPDTGSEKVYNHWKVYPTGKRACGMVDKDGNEWFINPQADNLVNLGDRYYEAQVPNSNIDEINVYFRCQFGRSLSGLPVFEKSFNSEFHVSKINLIPLRSEFNVEVAPIVVGMDFGRTPCAVFMQQMASGRINVLSEVDSLNMGLTTFIEKVFRPHVAAKYQGMPLVIAPDPAGDAKEQGSEQSLYDILRRYGYQVVKPVTNLVDPRIQAVESVLRGQIDGGPLVTFDPSCTSLIKGFKHGYRFKKRPKSEVLEDKPEKNEYSHLQDALQYGTPGDTIWSRTGLDGQRGGRFPWSILASIMLDNPAGCV